VSTGAGEYRRIHREIIDSFSKSSMLGKTRRFTVLLAPQGKADQGRFGKGMKTENSVPGKQK
jgi:hypothetical protein